MSHSQFTLKEHGIHVSHVLRNPSPALLYEEAVRHDHKAAISSQGALVAYSGTKTGRSPKDKRLVKNPQSEKDIWWGSINIPIDPHSFSINRERAKDWLNTRHRLYCIDAFAGWDPEYRVKVRIICSRPYHALFMNIMLIQPTVHELHAFGQPDYVIYNAGEFPANRHTTGMTSKTSVDISFEDGEVVILGTEYAGEMKKGVFTIMNYLMPKQGVLSMHCSATADPRTGESSLLFGLSGTGKTTLSADPKRVLIGDDEHCWTDRGIFNIEGGCYAKTINLSRESEPEIYEALHFGTVMENVVLGPEDREPLFDVDRITENTRAAYPIHYIHNARVPCRADHPSNVIFLACDAFGVLPPVSKLTPAQAMYHFISGYTARVAGTEVGVKEPQTVFSPCYGGPFLVWSPGRYADLLADRLRRHDANVWLVNTGWTGGPYGVGRRMKLALTRAIIDAIHTGELAKVPTKPDPVFGFDVVAACPGVPPEVLVPRDAWQDKGAYDATAHRLGRLFRENFEHYAGTTTDEVRAAGPRA